MDTAPVVVVITKLTEDMRAHTVRSSRQCLVVYINIQRYIVDRPKASTEPAIDNHYIKIDAFLKKNYVL